MKETRQVIAFHDVTKIYPLDSGDVTALNHVDVEVVRGEFIAIMGPSGSGKSTLLNMMGCLDIPTSGDVFISGQNIKTMNDDQLTELRRDVLGFIFQQFNLILLLDALENVQYPLILKTGETGCTKRCMEVLEAVGLAPHLWHHRPGQLSGGQQQRVAIARALVNDPEILLCDEPTGNLDTKTGMAIMDLLTQLCREQGKTIVMVTHDPRIAEYADRTILIEDGKIKEEIS
ncbi:ABC transporter ATP-binding protein [Methanospirillum stamsii]|uniref:Lipoprotein-releasing system ATP-binding protein LolD n=1 Tax=Methanospirillum stamsii TaxID=1277351 RepID=A0A2V2N6Y3_9EURY|nr:ABC transporter ATP-binding protein [Methanospirillum stamsii]PWR75599.1 lipoprotein-releasing system ATP-binding protein LolD [Methanospirillum stamsii]